MRCHQRGFYFAIGVLNSITVILLSISIGTNRWTEAVIRRKTAWSNGNSTKDATFTAGFKYIGLFHGCEEKKYGTYFIARSRCFNALQEYDAMATIELAYATLIASFASIGMHVVMIYASFYDELVRSAPKHIQCTLPLSAMVTTVLLGAVSSGSYLYLYMHYLRDSLLRPSDHQDGFSTKGLSSLGFSFWLMLASSILNILTFLILSLGILRRGETRLSFGWWKERDTEDSSERPTDAPVIMMY